MSHSNYGYARRDRSSNSSSSDQSLSGDDDNNLLYEIKYLKSTYNEKMARIAEDIYVQVCTLAHYGGYKIAELSDDLKRINGVSGEELAHLMAYPSFETMCINAPEMVSVTHGRPTRKATAEKPASRLPATNRDTQARVSPSKYARKRSMWRATSSTSISRSALTSTARRATGRTTMNWV